MTHPTYFLFHYRKQGGNINIITEALFGIQERPLNPLTNDLNASSEFGLDSEVSIVTPDINKIQTELNTCIKRLQFKLTTTNQSAMLSKQMMLVLLLPLLLFLINQIILNNLY